MNESNEIMSEHRCEDEMEDPILMLVDDCFLEIFKHLSLIDLANFTEVYPNVSAVAAMAFGRKTRGLSYFCQDEISTDDCLQVIKQFGSSIRHLTLHYESLGERKWSEIFSVIGEHCTENLKSLSLGLEAVGLIREADVSLIADVLKNIETLSIATFTYKGPAEFLTIVSHCENARSIELCGTAFDLPETIFQTNENLLKLKVRFVKDSDLKRVVDNLMNSRLEDLSIKIWKTKSIDENCSELLQLTYLKRLHIDSWGPSTLYSNAREVPHMDIHSFLRNVDAFNSLNVLSLRTDMLDETSIQILGQITRLKVLTLRECDPEAWSLQILCGNKNLEHLRLLCGTLERRTLKESKFRKYVETRKESAAENCLHITLTHSNYTTILKTIPEELLEANKDTIKLIDERDRNYECNEHSSWF